jgi:hypothetical protein
MTPAEALALMRERGMSLWAEGGALRWSAPPGVATARTIAFLDRHGEALLALLAAEAPANLANPEIANPANPANEAGGGTDERPAPVAPPASDDIEAKWLASAAWAREMAEERRLRSGWYGTVRCHSCNVERNEEIEPCPVCHPSPSLPAGCRARVACSVVGACDNGCHDVSHLAEIVGDLRQEA